MFGVIQYCLPCVAFGEAGSIQHLPRRIPIRREKTGPASTILLQLTPAESTCFGGLRMVSVERTYSYYQVSPVGPVVAQTFIPVINWVLIYTPDTINLNRNTTKKSSPFFAMLLDVGLQPFSFGFGKGATVLIPLVFCFEDANSTVDTLN